MHLSIFVQRLWLCQGARHDFAQEVCIVETMGVENKMIVVQMADALDRSGRILSLLALNSGPCCLTAHGSAIVLD
jgi:hypothetical protein